MVELKIYPDPGGGDRACCEFLYVVALVLAQWPLAVREVTPWEIVRIWEVIPWEWVAH